MRSSFDWDWAYVQDAMPQLLGGLLVTLRITVLAIGGSFVLGALLATGLSLNKRPLRAALSLWIDLVRGSPLLIQLFFWYYGLPQFGVFLDAELIGVLALSIYCGAYIAMVLKAGIDNLPKGQWEAAEVVGIRGATLWRRVVLPQVIRDTLPSIGNYAVLMFKYSPVLVAITVSEALSAALEVGGRTFRYLEPLTVVGALFVAVSVPVALLIRYAGRKHASAL